MSKPITSPDSPHSAFEKAPPCTIRAWSDARISPAERTAFLEDVVSPDNLRRAFWLLICYLPISLSGLVLNFVSLHNDQLGFLSYLDIGGALTFLAVIVYIRRAPAAIRWKRHLMTAFYFYNVGIMAAYYLAALPRFGETPYYTLGLFLIALITRMPPRLFIPLILCTHAIYCTVLLRVVSGDALTAALFTGTNAVILAILASWFLFHRDWETYENNQVIAQRNRELAAANARLNEMMAIAAHDLRSPLASLISYIDLLNSSREWQPEPYRGTLREWHDILQDMLNLIGRMLHAHRAESQTQAPATELVDVLLLIQRSVAKLQHSAQAKGIRIDVPASGSFQIQTSLEPLGQALDNIISNAVKFSPLDSRVEVRVHQDTATCTIAVQDEGPGIHPDEAAQLFTKFHRGRNTPTGGEATSGLGLFIVSQLMASLGGTVAYEPAHPTGTIFRLRVPNGSARNET